jgi:Acyclic terpene utilisation family protein AtuA
VLTSAFWGDSVHAARQLVEEEDAKLDFLVGDYLAGCCLNRIVNGRDYDGSSCEEKSCF